MLETKSLSFDITKKLNLLFFFQSHFVTLGSINQLNMKAFSE